MESFTLNINYQLRSSIKSRDKRELKKTATGMLGRWDGTEKWR